jgi:hypothetical protein
LREKIVGVLPCSGVAVVLGDFHSHGSLHEITTLECWKSRDNRSGAMCCEFVSDDTHTDAASDRGHPCNVWRDLLDRIDLNVDQERADGCGFVGLLFLGPPSDLFIMIEVFLLRSELANPDDMASNLSA